MLCISLSKHFWSRRSRSLFYKVIYITNILAQEVSLLFPVGKCLIFFNTSSLIVWVWSMHFSFTKQRPISVYYNFELPVFFVALLWSSLPKIWLSWPLAAAAELKFRLPEFLSWLLRSVTGMLAWKFLKPCVGPWLVSIVLNFSLTAASTLCLFLIVFWYWC